MAAPSNCVSHSPHLYHPRAVGRGGGSGGSDFVHFLCEVLGQRSVQKEPF